MKSIYIANYYRDFICIGLFQACILSQQLNSICLKGIELGGWF